MAENFQIPYYSHRISYLIKYSSWMLEKLCTPSYVHIKCELCQTKQSFTINCLLVAISILSHHLSNGCPYCIQVTIDTTNLIRCIFFIEIKRYLIKSTVSNRSNTEQHERKRLCHFPFSVCMFKENFVMSIPFRTVNYLFTY